MKVGFVGFRGMVGSVLINRMISEGDFKAHNIQTYFFSTSQAGNKITLPFATHDTLLDAYNIDELKQMDIIVSTQSGTYTNTVFENLRNAGYNGYYIDASSALRMRDDTIIALSPVNQDIINHGIQNGIKNFAGGNCSITLSLIGLHGLFRENLIKNMSMMTYQAASGAGALYVRELLKQMAYVVDSNHIDIMNDDTTILDLMNNVGMSIKSDGYPIDNFKTQLAGSVIPWIDMDLNDGSSKEEEKAEAEANKIFGLPPQTIKIDGLCIRVGTVRSHCNAITMQLKEKLSIGEIEKIIKHGNQWVHYVPNNKTSTMDELNPIYTSNTLNISVGRLKKSTLGDDIYHVFTVGDQLLWGASEPLRQVLLSIINFFDKKVR